MPLFELDGMRVKAHKESWVAPNAMVMGQVVLHKDVSVWFNAVLRGDNDLIEIGEGSNIQDGAVLHTDGGIQLRMGKGVTVGHMAMLHGCTIGDNCLIGIGATILNNVKIGSNCLIGAHALIPEGKEIPDNSMVVGAPGRIVKTINADMEEMLKINASVYVKNWQRFSKGLKLQDGSHMGDTSAIAGREANYRFLDDGARREERLDAQAGDRSATQAGEAGEGLEEAEQARRPTPL